jgi:hypothetical protein
MLQDVVDLRRNQWKPRRDVAGPKTIEQVIHNYLYFFNNSCLKLASLSVLIASLGPFF